MLWNSENVYGFCIYLLVTGLEIALTMFVAYVQHQAAKNASNWRKTAESFGSFYKKVDVGSIDPFASAYNWLSRKTAKNSTKFLSNFFVTCLRCVMTKINKSQKISTCYVKYVLFISEKTKQKELIDPFGPSRVKVAAVSNDVKVGYFNKIDFEENLFNKNCAHLLTVYPLQLQK